MGRPDSLGLNLGWAKEGSALATGEAPQADEAVPGKELGGASLAALGGLFIEKDPAWQSPLQM